MLKAKAIIKAKNTTVAVGQRKWCRN